MKRPRRRRSGEKDDEPTAPARRSPAGSTRVTKKDALEIIRQDWDPRSFKHLDWNSASGDYRCSRPNMHRCQHCHSGTTMQIEYTLVREPYGNNARTHSLAQIKQIAKSIEKFGFS